jgi:hypothetical protein
VTEELHSEVGIGAGSKHGKQLDRLSKDCLELSRALEKILERYG